MTKARADRENELIFLCDIELKYTGRLPEAEAVGGRIGEYIGSGRGWAKGRCLQGRIPRWDLYEEVNGAVCRSNLNGIIITNDSAEINFDTMGFYTRQEWKPHIWSTVAAVRFVTSDERYAWLDNSLGLWEGSFDMESHIHTYCIYARRLP